MDLLLALQYVLCLLAVLSLWRSRMSRPPVFSKKGDQLTKLPPQPAGAWPLVGHLPLLGGDEIAARTLGRMADAYGPVFMLRLGAHRTLVISSHEAARECFTTWDRSFASRPRIAAAKYLGYDNTIFGLTSCESIWREMRKMSAAELLSPTRLGKLRHMREGELDARMRELYELCATVGRRPAVEMKQWFEDTTLNVIVGMVAGRRYEFTERNIGGGGGEAEQMRRFQKALADFLYLAGAFVPSDALPWLEWLDLQGYIKAMKKTAGDLDAVLDVWIEEHRQGRRSAAGEQDFIDVMLSSIGGANLADLDPDIGIKGTVLSMVLGGTEPSAVTMTWTLALLMNNRRVLDKVREELDLHVGAGRKMEEADAANLVYLNAVMKEAMRLYPVAPLSVPHEASEDCRVGGYHVPKGTRLLTNLWKLHRDPRVWKDPLEFRPERFLDGEAAGVKAGGQHFQYLPFSSGRRICPGITLALRVMQLTLGRLLHEFDVETPDGGAVDMGEGPGMHITKADPLEVLLTPRLPRLGSTSSDRHCRD